MHNKLKPGIKLSQKYTIAEKDLASTLKTSDVKYAASPSLIILMEQVTCAMIQDSIGENYTTVSAEINMKHLLPVSVSEEVLCSVHLKFFEDSKLFFDFAIFNMNEDVVAIGAHERAIVKRNEY